jgi:hypothetical protein
MMQTLSTAWNSVSVWLRGCLTLLLGSFLLLGLLYGGYCWGWWGRTNLTLQYLFQCQCPPGSEDARYRPYRVLAAACTDPRPRDIAPSGRYIIIEERRPVARLIRHDLLGGQSHTLDLQPVSRMHVNHLNDQLLFVLRANTSQASLWNLQMGRQIPLPFVKTFRLDPATRSIFQAAEQVLVFNDYILALAPDYLQHPDQNIVLDTVSGRSRDQVTQALTAAGVDFTLLPEPYTTGPVRDARYSHDGRFYARRDGIYRADTQERIVRLRVPRTHPAAAFRPSSWTADNRRVIYVAANPSLIGDDEGGGYKLHLLPVPQPILLVEGVGAQHWLHPGRMHDSVILI